MRRYANDLDEQGVSNDQIDDSPLLVESGGTVALPVAGQRLISKAFDGAKPLRPRKRGNVFPFLVSLQDLDWNQARGELFVRLSVFFDSPHSLL